MLTLHGAALLVRVVPACGEPPDHFELLRLFTATIAPPVASSARALKLMKVPSRPVKAKCFLGPFVRGFAGSVEVIAGVEVDAAGGVAGFDGGAGGVGAVGGVDGVELGGVAPSVL